MGFSISISWYPASPGFGSIQQTFSIGVLHGIPALFQNHQHTAKAAQGE
jgi:hypothetical protein